MSWNSFVSVEKPDWSTKVVTPRPTPTWAKVDLNRVITVDFETYWDKDYTLKKMSTSDYVRDPRFKAHMMSMKIGKRKTRVIKHERIQDALDAVDWTTHSLLAHNTAFDGFIASHHYNVVPSFYLDSLSMARGLHSNDIGAGLDEVARYYGVGNKTPNVLESSKGIRDLPPALYKSMALYCANDDDLCFDIFQRMLEVFPQTELELVDQIIRMFCDPILTIDRKLVRKEHNEELERKKKLLLSIAPDIEAARKVVGSRDGFRALLVAEGIVPPVKLNKNNELIDAFAKTDIEFTRLLEHPKERVRDLVEARLGIRSSIGETRALRFLKATEKGYRLPVGYAYYRAHTGRLGGNNKMNLQNLKRGGQLRRSIRAPARFKLPVADSSQIEARINAWLWNQNDLLDSFALSDNGQDRDPYCKFGDVIYGRVITKKDAIERFVGKVCVLGLGYQMGAQKLQNTLASGAMGMAVHISLTECQQIVTKYRTTNGQIKEGWDLCMEIIRQMATGKKGQWKCLYWEKNKIWLPNGMCLKYPGLRKVSSPEAREEWAYDSNGVWKKIYGGLLAENIVQALARIVVTTQLLAVAKTIRVVMMTHDEIVGLVPASKGAAALAYMLDLMRISPDWCASVPLNAEGSCEIYYSK